MGRFKSAFNMTATQDLVQSQFQQKKKNQPINVLVCVIRNTKIKIIIIKI